MFRIAMLFLNKQTKETIYLSPISNNQDNFFSMALRLLSPQSYGDGDMQPVSTAD